MEALTGVSRVIIGGINSFKFVDVAGIDVWPTAANLVVDEADITLKSGYNWQTGSADHNSLIYEETEFYTPQGPVIEAVLNGFLPDDLLVNAQSILSSFNKKYIVIFKTHQGTGRVVGTPDDPCLFTFKTTTAKLGGRKGIDFTFKKKALGLALYLLDLNIFFYINNLGFLIQEGTNNESLSINSDGQLVVTGPGEGDYSINASGQLVKA